MGRGDTSIASHEYDNYLASKKSKSSERELIQRRVERKMAHSPDGVGWHFGLGDAPVRVDSREHFKKELDKRGLMMAHEVKKDLR